MIDLARLHPARVAQGTRRRLPAPPTAEKRQGSVTVEAGRREAVALVERHWRG